MTIILVDQDGVLADWAGQFIADLAAAAPEFTPDLTRWDFGLADASPEIRFLADRIKYRPGFYATLKPIAGGREALNEMLAAGYDVRICTTPEVLNPTCLADKLAWVEREIGPGWGQRIIFTHDKTLVRGDILIDDKPVITGAAEPEWEQVVFSQPYNQCGPSDMRLRLFDWSFWRGVLSIVPPPATPKPEPRLIGIGGLLTSGKDTVADYLVDQHGWVKLNMSGILHEAMMALNPIVWPTGGISGSVIRPRRYAEEISSLGYTGAKELPEVRRLLQALGTDVGRNLLGENVWVDAMRKKIAEQLDAGRSVIVSGIRFPNEVGLINGFSEGETWWVDRGLVNTSTHASENSVSANDFTRTIDNTTTLEDLFFEVETALTNQNRTAA